MLTVDEEATLETYMIDMAEYGHLLSIEQLRLKVALITQERPTPFIDGIPRRRWCHGRDIETKTNDDQQRLRKLLRKLCIAVAKP